MNELFNTVLLSLFVRHSFADVYISRYIIYIYIVILYHAIVTLYDDVVTTHLYDTVESVYEELRVIKGMT